MAFNGAGEFYCGEGDKTPVQAVEVEIEEV
jgi:hypothetical protein